MAKYRKDGKPVTLRTAKRGKPVPANAKIMKPATRDHRKYSDVVLGLQQNPELGNTKLEGGSNIIPISFSLNVTTNMDMAEKLNQAVIAENSEALNNQHILPSIEASGLNVISKFSLSPTKLLLVFGSKKDAYNAVNMDSPLWDIFDDVRLWAEGETYDDRLVWIDCIGIHPLCWSMENLKLIGEKWGPVLHIDNKMQGVDSISRARVLLRTKTQNKIDQ